MRLLGWRHCLQKKIMFCYVLIWKHYKLSETFTACLVLNICMFPHIVFIIIIIIIKNTVIFVVILNLNNIMDINKTSLGIDMIQPQNNN